MTDRPKPLWSFAVLADTHLEADDDAVSNIRLRDIVTALNTHRPDFVLHLGDVVHPLPGAAKANLATGISKEILGRLDAPLRLVPGNHDIGDKPMENMPAAHVTPESRQRWLDNYGDDFTVLDHKDCRLVLCNSPLLNQSPTVNEELSRFLAETLHGKGGKRLFLITHYPLFLAEPDEPGHYDNVSQPARDLLLNYCREAGVEAVFTGHIHHYLYRAVGSTAFYGAPSTAFLRRDFSEMFHVGPLAEYGRQDPGKIGFLWVDVHPDGHAVRMVALNDLEDFATAGLVAGHPRDGMLPLGVNLRHDWAKVTELPFNPPVDTFTRKKVRDDYTLRALIELGVRDLRVPSTDLLDREKMLRLAEMHSLGFRFCLFQFGPPAVAVVEALDRYGPLIDALELACLVSARQELLTTLAPLADRHGFALWHGPLYSPEFLDAKVAHRIRYGFDPSCGDEAASAAREITGFGGRRGVVFSAQMAAFTEEDAARIAGFAEEAGLEAAVLLDRSADDMVAVRDDEAVPRHVEEMLKLGSTYPRLRLILDSLMDVDRGYHARGALVDRRLNPTAAGSVLRDAHRVRLTD